MKAYVKLCAVGDDGEIPLIAHKDIEAEVRRKPKRKPRKRKRDSILTEADMATRVGDLEDAYLKRGPHAMVITPVRNDDGLLEDLEARLDSSEVNIDAVQGTQSHHRAAVDMDTGWINLMVEACMRTERLEGEPITSSLI